MPNDYRQPEYLGPSHYPTRRIRCPVHGFIRFSDAERKLIDHEFFRRLRRIRQLALTELVYPGATHTRFEHSLGVMEMATRMFDRLAADRGSVMESVFQQVEALREETLAKARQICRLAALLHDAGHSCFSHAAESVFHRNSQHESLSILLIKDDAYLRPLLEREFFPGCADLTAALIKPDRRNPIPQIRLLRDIISGQIDADRTDYLLRDSHHCGVEYGRFDYRRLIECLSLWHDEDTDELEMAIRDDGIHSFESLILARHQMNTQVYYHRLRLIYDLYLKNFFQDYREAHSDAFSSPERVLEWNDVRAMWEIMQSANDSQSPGHQWAKRITERKHHRDVFSINEGSGTQALRYIKQVFDQIQTEFDDVEFLADLRDQPVTIHRILRPEDQDEESIDFAMLQRGDRTSLGRRSQILKTLPKCFRIGVIFADVTDSERRREVSDHCRRIFARLNQ